MKKTVTTALLAMSLHAAAQTEATTAPRKDKDITLSALYVINTSGYTISGGTLALSVKDVTVLAMLQYTTDQEANFNETKTAIYNLGVGHRIARLGNFQTRAYMGIGVIRTTTITTSTYANGNFTDTYDDFKPNLSFGLLGDGRYLSFLAGVESNYTGMGLVLGIGINSGLLR